MSPIVVLSAKEAIIVPLSLTTLNALALTFEPSIVPLVMLSALMFVTLTNAAFSVPVLMRPASMLPVVMWLPSMTVVVWSMTGVVQEHVVPEPPEYWLTVCRCTARKHRG